MLASVVVRLLPIDQLEHGASLSEAYVVMQHDELGSPLMSLLSSSLRLCMLSFKLPASEEPHVRRQMTDDKLQKGLLSRDAHELRFLSDATNPSLTCSRYGYATRPPVPACRNVKNVIKHQRRTSHIPQDDGDSVAVEVGRCT